MSECLLLRSRSQELPKLIEQCLHFTSFQFVCSVKKTNRKASITLSLDLCPYFMEGVVRQASFPFHNSQKFALILEVPSVEKTKLRRRSVHFTYKQNKKCEMDYFND